MFKKTRSFPIWSFVVREKSNRKLALIGMAGMIVQLFVFKWFYPFPDFVPDSYIYIKAAADRLSAGILPIGYAKFLLFFHMLTHSSAALVACQYLILEVVSLYAFFCFLFLLSPNRLNRNLLFVLLLFNPLFLFIGNYITPDALFLAVSMLWFTQLMLLVSRPILLGLAVHAILLLFCVYLTDCYYYLLLSIVGILLAMSRPWFKIVGVSAVLVVVIGLAAYMRSEIKKISGTDQLSMNRGWELGNSALFARRHLAIDSLTVPFECRELDQIARNYFSHASSERLDDYLNGYTTNFFIDNPEAPLKKYLGKHVLDFYPDGPATWGSASIVFREYANWLIGRYPVNYSRYYLLPNVGNYFLPPLESLENYNQGNDEMLFEGQDWFGYDTPIVASGLGSTQGTVLLPFPYLFLIVHVFYVGGIVWWVLKRKLFSRNVAFNRLVYLSASFFVVNLVVHVTGAPVTLRQQVFPLIVTTCFAILLLEYFDKKAAVTEVISAKSGLALK